MCAKSDQNLATDRRFAPSVRNQMARVERAGKRVLIRLDSDDRILLTADDGVVLVADRRRAEHCFECLVGCAIARLFLGPQRAGSVRLFTLRR